MYKNKINQTSCLELNHALNRFVGVFTPSQWQYLDRVAQSIVADAPELIEYPDRGQTSNEALSVGVVRLFNYKAGNEPEVEPYKKDILKIFSQAKLLEKISALATAQNRRLTLRRVQLNLMSTGAFVGCHRDSDHDKHYQVTAIIRLNSGCTGGELMVYGQDGDLIVRQHARSVFVMDSTMPHEVLRVTQGLRNSLIVVAG